MLDGNQKNAHMKHHYQINYQQNMQSETDVIFGLCNPQHLDSCRYQLKNYETQHLALNIANVLREKFLRNTFIIPNKD